MLFISIKYEEFALAYLIGSWETTLQFMFCYFKTHSMDWYLKIVLSNFPVYGCNKTNLMLQKWFTRICLHGFYVKK